jgi:streptogramin lyase
MRGMTIASRFLSLGVAAVTLAACTARTGTAPNSPSAAGPARIVRSGSLQFQVYTAGETKGFLSTASAIDIAAGPNGTLWFTDGGTPAIGEITSSGTITEYTAGLPAGAEPNAIAAGPDGNMWFSDYRGIVIGKITSSGTITEYANTSYTDTKAEGIAFGPGGEPFVIGFGAPPVLAGVNSQGTIAVQVLPKNLTPDGSLTDDASGNLWFSAANAQMRAELYERPATGKHLLRLPMHMVSQRVPCCPHQAADPMTIGPGGVPWFTTTSYLHGSSPYLFLGVLQKKKVALLRLSFKGLTGSAYPSGIAGAQDAVWVTGSNPFKDSGALWRVASKKHQTAYNLPYNPISVTVDASGNPWFTASSSGSPSQIIEVVSTASNQTSTSSQY